MLKGLSGVRVIVSEMLRWNLDPAVTACSLESNRCSRREEFVFCPRRSVQGHPGIQTLRVRMGYMEKEPKDILEGLRIRQGPLLQLENDLGFLLHVSIRTRRVGFPGGPCTLRLGQNTNSSRREHLFDSSEQAVTGRVQVPFGAFRKR